MTIDPFVLSFNNGQGISGMFVSLILSAVAWGVIAFSLAAGVLLAIKLI